MRLGIKLTAAALGLVVLILGAQMAARYLGWSVPRDRIEDRAALLVPDYSWHLPEGAGPFPAAVLASGCDGPHDNMDRWAARLNAEGWAALVVDSHAPRDLDDLQVWRLVCAGQIFTGTERAGDLLVGLEALRAHPKIDTDHLALLGASHGGWAVLDLLAQAERARPPQGLRNWPGGSVDAAMAGLVGTIVLYPYCGPGSLASRRAWTRKLPILMMLVDGDTITDDQPCRDVAARQTALGTPLQIQEFNGVTHGFDQRERAAFSPLEFDPDATAAALDLGADFLNGLTQDR